MKQKQNINSLIEAQDEESKNRTFEKLQNKLVENEADISQSNQNVLAKKAFWQKKNFVIIISVAFLFILTGILLLLLLPKKDALNEFRYCSVSDYYTEFSEQSIKQYAASNEKDILAFDTENKFELLLDQKYKLNATNEVICLYEELVDQDFLINIYVTDNFTQLDFLSNYLDVCSNNTQINSVEISYGMDVECSYAKFEYSGYVYYLKVLENTNNEYVLSLVAELLNDTN